MKNQARWVSGIAGVVVAAGMMTGAQAPPAASPAKAKELAALMIANKMEVFAARDGSQPGRYVAAILVPNVQLLVVSAAYSREGDLEYSLHTKAYQTAFLDLKSGIYARDRFFVDDALADGLVAAPGRIPQHDSVTIDTTTHVFDGNFADSPGRNAKKIPTSVYMKAFSEADARYTKTLEALLAALKGAPLASPAGLR